MADREQEFLGSLSKSLCEKDKSEGALKDIAAMVISLMRRIAKL